MIQFGKTLKDAREAKGLTIAQIAESTHMMSTTIQDLENENFTRLAAPIYGRGFVKLYCEAVGLDPKPLIAEFMDLYNGNHEPTIRERPVPASRPVPEPKPVPAPKPVSEPEPISAPEPPHHSLAERTPFSDESSPAPTSAPSSGIPPPLPHTVLQPGLFDPPVPEAQPAAPMPAREPIPASCPKTAEPTSAPIPAESDKPTFARYASPLSDHNRDLRDGLGSPAIWRWALIGVALLLVLWGAAVGLKALYRATSSPCEQQPACEQPAVEKQTTSAVPAPKPATRTRAARTPQDIPPLYLD